MRIKINFSPKLEFELWSLVEKLKIHLLESIDEFLSIFGGSVKVLVFF